LRQNFKNFILFLLELDFDYLGTGSFMECLENTGRTTGFSFVPLIVGLGLMYFGIGWRTFYERFLFLKIV
jgi:hypothetical protein